LPLSVCLSRMDPPCLDPALSIHLPWPVLRICHREAEAQLQEANRAVEEAQARCGQAAMRAAEAERRATLAEQALSRAQQTTAGADRVVVDNLREALKAQEEELREARKLRDYVRQAPSPQIAA
jgi:hypothetical protein